MAERVPQRDDLIVSCRHDNAPRESCPADPHRVRRPLHMMWCCSSAFRKYRELSATLNEQETHSAAYSVAALADCIVSEKMVNEQAIEPILHSV